MKPKFHIGDLVQYVGKDHAWEPFDLQIIQEMAYHSEWVYATTSGAWFGDSDFELVEAASDDTFEILEYVLTHGEEDDNEWL
jgi:hypothetical protein